MKQIFFIIVLVLSSLYQLEAQQNPFISAPEGSSGTEKQVKKTALPGTGIFFNSPLMQKIKSIQKEIQTKISGYISEYKTNRKLSTLFTFLLSSFLYGLLHVLGPGHRKIFLFSYFVSKPSRWKQGMFAGFMTAILHAVSAIIFIGGLYLITSRALLRRFNNISPVLERISYGAIVIIGVYLLIHHIITRRSSGHSHSDTKHNPDTILFILVSGLIPCPGAATIMIFSLAVGAPVVGIYAVLAMSLGMAVVLAMVPPAAILIQNRLEPFLSQWNPSVGEKIHDLFSIAGSVVMIIFGLLFIV